MHINCLTMSPIYSSVTSTRGDKLQQEHLLLEIGSYRTRILSLPLKLLLAYLDLVRVVLAGWTGTGLEFLRFETLSAVGMPIRIPLLVTWA